VGRRALMRGRVRWFSADANRQKFLLLFSKRSAFFLLSLAQPPRAKNAQHSYIASRIVAASIRVQAVDDNMALADQFAQARMVADGIEAGNIQQATHRGSDRLHAADGGFSGARLGLPTPDSIEISDGLVGITQRSWHLVVQSAAGFGRRKFVVCAEAINPGINLIAGDRSAVGRRCSCHGDQLGFRRNVAPTRELGGGAVSVVGFGHSASIGPRRADCHDRRRRRSGLTSWP